MNKVTVNFGGFYESHHGAVVEDVMEDEDFYALAKEYADEWVNKLNNELNTNLAFVELVSPKKYNYSTDTITCEFSDKDIETVRLYLCAHALGADVISHCRDITTSKSGYAAFHTFHEVVRSASLFLQCKLDVIINQLGTDYPFTVEDFNL